MMEITEVIVVLWFTEDEDKTELISTLARPWFLLVATPPLCFAECEASSFCSLPRSRQTSGPGPFVLVLVSVSIHPG